MVSVRFSSCIYMPPSPCLLSLFEHFCSCFSLFRTLYLEGERKLDFAGWCAAIQTAGGCGGDTLSQQQLTETDIPIIVHSCISYITQCGETHMLFPPPHDVTHTHPHAECVCSVVVVFLDVSVCANLAFLLCDSCVCNCRSSGGQ